MSSFEAFWFGVFIAGYFGFVRRPKLSECDMENRRYEIANRVAAWRVPYRVAKWIAWHTPRAWL